MFNPCIRLMWYDASNRDNERMSGMSGNMPPQYPNSAHHAQADAEATRRAQEYQRQQQEAAEAARKAQEIAEAQRREAERAAADQANRVRWSSQRH